VAAIPTHRTHGGYHPAIALGAFAAVLFAIVVLMAFALSFLMPTAKVAPQWTLLGNESRFALNSVTHIENLGLFLVRYKDGSFSAFPDTDLRFRYKDAYTKNRCRLVEWKDSYLGTLDNVSGFEGRGLREPCFLSTFDMKGKRAYGPPPRDLETIPVRIKENGVIEVRTADVAWLD
jgi:hypothetical protein